MARVVFMGSPEFAVPSLDALVEAHSVVGVVTQPDRPAGRRSLLRPPPLKVAAEGHGLAVFQPRTLRSEESMVQLTEWAPEVIVVVAFGQLLPPPVLELSPHGSLNIHASLLPRWRGAAPIAAAILAGDEVTGVTVMSMDEGLDTGPILAQCEQRIRPDDTTASLADRLARLGATLLLETLPPYLTGDLKARPQPVEGVTSCGLLTKEDGRLDWSRTAIELDRQVRAAIPWPGAFTTWDGRQLKILAATPLADWQGSQPLGTVLAMDGGAAVVTGEGALKLLEVQLAGKKALPIDVFLCGQQACLGALLGN